MTTRSGTWVTSAAIVGALGCGARTGDLGLAASQDDGGATSSAGGAGVRRKGVSPRGGSGGTGGRTPSGGGTGGVVKRAPGGGGESGAPESATGGIVGSFEGGASDATLAAGGTSADAGSPSLDACNGPGCGVRSQ